MELMNELSSSLIGNYWDGRHHIAARAPVRRGEQTALLMFRAYHEKHSGGPRKTVIIPDSAHGTNPAIYREYRL